MGGKPKAGKVALQLLDELGLQENWKPVYFAVDLMIAVDQSDPTDPCANLHALATALHLQVFDESD